MGEIKDGGPAFPAEVPAGVVYNMSTQANELEYSPTPGMTLRDYFAAKALQSFLIANPVHLDGCAEFSDYASDAYKIADALLEARQS